MKFPQLFIGLTLLASACGSNDNYLKDTGTYEVRKDLSVTGNLVLSFQQVFLFRSIAVGEAQSSACEAFAKDHEKRTGIAVVPGSLKVTFDDEPSKHCARRNTLKQCESSQYVYTFYCKFQV